MTLLQILFVISIVIWYPILIFYTRLYFLAARRASIRVAPFIWAGLFLGVWITIETTILAYIVMFEISGTLTNVAVHLIPVSLIGQGIAYAIVSYYAIIGTENGANGTND